MHVMSSLILKMRRRTEDEWKEEKGKCNCQWYEKLCLVGFKLVAFLSSKARAIIFSSRYLHSPSSSSYDVIEANEEIFFQKTKHQEISMIECTSQL